MILLDKRKEKLIYIYIYIYIYTHIGALKMSLSPMVDQCDLWFKSS